MRNQPGIWLLSVGVLMSSMNFSAQATQKQDPPEKLVGAIPVRTVDLSHTEAISNWSSASNYGSGAICSSDGIIYTQPHRNIASYPAATIGQIYSISDQREVKEVDLKYPNEYSAVVPQGLFATEGKVVSLLKASGPKDPQEVLARGQSITFLSIADTQGGEPTLIRLQLAFQPTKAAIFASGKLLVSGVDTANLVPVLALLHEDGTLEQMFDLDSRTYQKSEELKKVSQGRRIDPNSTPAQRLVNRAMASAEFVPWGKTILLVQPGTKLPIYKLTDAGTQEEIKVQLPGDQTLRRVLASGDRDTWVVVSRGSVVSQNGPFAGMKTRARDSYFEMNPYSGEVIDQLTLDEPDGGEIVCAANGKISGVYRDYKDDSEEHVQMTYASAPR